MAYLTNPETKLASGMISRPNLSLAKEISMVAIMFAAASQTLESAKAWPGHILKESIGCEKIPRPEVMVLVLTSFQTRTQHPGDQRVRNAPQTSAYIALD